MLPQNWIWLRCLEKGKNILPQGGLIVTYNGTIRKQITLNNKSKDSSKIIKQRKTFKALIIDPPPTVPESFPSQSSSQAEAGNRFQATWMQQTWIRRCTRGHAPLIRYFLSPFPTNGEEKNTQKCRVWGNSSAIRWPSDHAKLQKCRVPTQIIHQQVASPLPTFTDSTPRSGSGMGAYGWFKRPRLPPEVKGWWVGGWLTGWTACFVVGDVFFRFGLPKIGKLTKTRNN